MFNATDSRAYEASSLTPEQCRLAIGGGVGRP